MGILGVIFGMFLVARLTVVLWCGRLVPGPIHDAFSTSFMQACDDALDRAVTISLQVRQQLERVYQIVCYIALVAPRAL